MKSRSGPVTHVFAPLRLVPQRFAFPLLILASVLMLLVGQLNRPMAVHVRVAVADVIAPVLEVVHQPVAVAARGGCPGGEGAAAAEDDAGAAGAAAGPAIAAADCRAGGDIAAIQRHHAGATGAAGTLPDNRGSAIAAISGDSVCCNRCSLMARAAEGAPAAPVR